VVADALIVDDDASIREALRQVLEGEGFTSIAASNGAEALARLAGGPVPRLILLDLMMPVMDGETTLATLKRDARYRDIPVVVMTASTDRKVDGVPLLRKPFVMTLLIDLISTHLGG
jgi:CheY-like chemotaxis protein